MSSASADDRERLLRLGSRTIGIRYPVELAAWLDARSEPAGPAVEPRIEVRRVGEGGFAVACDGEASGPLGLGDALGVVWDRAAHLLLEPMNDALALHAAAALLGQTLVVIPGASGAGKSRLALWFRAQGGRLLTDEVACFAPAGAGGRPELAGTLRRPVFLKGIADAGPLLGGDPAAQVQSGYGLIVDIDGGAAPAGHERIVFLFPRFDAGAALRLTPLTPGEATLRLMGQSLNVRNLARGGLPIAAELARNAVSIALDYGSTEQIEGLLDTLVLTAPGLAPDRLAAFCAAIARTGTAPAAPGNAPAAAPTPEPPPPATAERFARRLTVGMATYDDYDGTYFTVQALRLANPELRDEIEFVVIDNNPGGPCSKALAGLARSIPSYRYVPEGRRRGTAVRDALFAEASSPIVLCVDAHVLIEARGLPALLRHFEADEGSRDLVQGPMVYDSLASISTHWEPEWRGGMYGTWATDPRGLDPEGPAFDIPMLGLGLFACRRDAWPGFNPAFHGFGGEEGYIHEKVRRRGGRTLCLPALRWVHRFGRPMGVPYVNRWEDRIRNYLIGFAELGWDTLPVIEHFATIIGQANVDRIAEAARRELELGPCAARAGAVG